MKKSKTTYLTMLIVTALTITACSNSTNTSEEESKKSATEALAPETDEAVAVEDTVSNEVTAIVEESISDIEADLINIDITSSSLKEDGKWLSVITKSKGDNKSPQLSWDPVDDAAYYAIYMFDTSAGNWLHWMAKDVVETELELGVKLENNKYVGPYPPSGTHTYEVIIYALSATPDSYLGMFDSTNNTTDKIIRALDTSSGKTGNIIGKGAISGTYISGEIVE